MHPSSRLNDQAGFSIMEMMIASVVMLVITSAVVSLMKASMSSATAAYEMSDAQESLRTAQEFIGRDLMSAGDGLRTMTNIPVTTTFVTNYLTLSPISDPLMPAGVTNLGILTTDNDVTAGTTVFGPDPAVATVPLVTVRSNPAPTDRQTILEIDPNFTPISLPAGSINASGSTVTIADGDFNRFTNGEVYFLTSSLGGTFGTITGTSNIVGPTSTLTFAAGSAAGDKFGFNDTGANGRIKTISNSGALVTSLQRMRIIHYYIDSTGRLMRRIFGVRGVGFRESAIAEHVVSVQFLYSLGPNAAGAIQQPVSRLSNLDEQIAVRQVEVTVTVETTHGLARGLRSLISSTTSTSVRNMQFRQALQPTAIP